MAEEKAKNTLEDLFLNKDCSHKISLLEKLLNEETFYWSYVPKDVLIKFTDIEFAKLVLDGRTPKPLFLGYSIDKKVFMFCHLYHWICKTCKTHELMDVVEIFYKIEYQCSNGIPDKINGLPVVRYIMDKVDSNIIKAVENEPSLQTVMKYYYQNDIKTALIELRKITEFSSEKNAKFKKFIQSQSTELQEMCQQVYKFITNYSNHNGKFADATETEARVWFDLGLSIYRLFTIYGDL